MTANIMGLGLSALHTVQELRDLKPLQRAPGIAPLIDSLEITILTMFYGDDEDNDGSGGGSGGGNSRKAFIRSVCRSLDFLAEEATRKEHVDVARQLLECKATIQALPEIKH